MNENLISNNKVLYDKILDSINKELSSQNFEENLKKVQEIDSKHYKEKITINDMRKYLEEYKTLGNELKEKKKVMIVLAGNPEIVFKVCLEILKSNLDAIIGIQDYCLAQNTLIVEMINNIIENNNLRIKVELKNLLKDSEIISKAKEVDKAICIGDSNLYNRLENQISNLELNPYGIFEVYSDSDEFEELEKTFFDYCYQNEFEAEDYSELEFEDALRLINKNGYKFCTVLFSKDEEKQKIFKTIDSKYIIINKNPFKEIKFKLEI